MGESLLAGDHAVAATEHPGRGAAGGCQGLKAEPGQDPRGTGVPGVGDDEKSRSLVQRTKAVGFVELAGRHAMPPGGNWRDCLCIDPGTRVTSRRRSEYPVSVAEVVRRWRRSILAAIVG